MIPLIGLIVDSVKKETSTIWCFFDEPDNTLHPQWQRKMIQTMCGVCDKENKDFQIWISTHSPIMLSDVPKQAAIFLKVNEKANKKEQKSRIRSSFAQQIYTLYNDAFFMKQGVIGAFAEEKISAVYCDLSAIEEDLFDNHEFDLQTAQDKLDFAKEIIACLDEPLLKGHLQLIYKRCSKELNKRMQQN